MQDRFKFRFYDKDKKIMWYLAYFLFAFVMTATVIGIAHWD